MLASVSRGRPVALRLRSAMHGQLNANVMNGVVAVTQCGWSWGRKAPGRSWSGVPGIDDEDAGECPFSVQNPDFEQVVRASFARQTYMVDTLGATVRFVRPGCVALQCEYSDRLLQQHGYYHGGVAWALCDSAAGYAAMTLFEPGHAPLTSQVDIHLLRPAQGVRLIGVGKVVKPGKTLNVVDMKCWAMMNDAPGEEKVALIATGHATVFNNEPSRGHEEPAA